MAQDKLQDCLSIFNALIHSRFRFTLEDGTVFELFFTPSNLPHLLGLHKLKDIPGLQGTSGGRIYQMLSEGELTYDTLRRSKYYDRIAPRLERFHLLPLLFFGQVIVDFDSAKLEQTDLRKTRYIFFLRQPDGIVHLTLGEKSVQSRLQSYPETFFHDRSKRYITGQALLNITKVEITHP